jgi:DNA (cytosine-5)-methyltransferase 3A
MKVLSLFDGMSVAQQALKDSGIPVEVYYASEIDPYAISVTQSNFPITKQIGDVKNVSKCILDENDTIDLLVGGSPCQDLSIANKNRQGLSGDRSGLFWEYLRIRNEIKPKYFILENVLSMSKEAKDTISYALGVEPIMINAALVSAQNRKRLFWVGQLQKDGYYKKVEICQPKDMGILLKDILESNVDEKYYVKINEKYGLKGFCDLNEKSKSMTASMYKVYGNDGVTTVRVGTLNKGGQGERIYSADGKSITISSSTGGFGGKTGIYAVAQRGRNIVNGVRKDVVGAKTEQRIEVGKGDKAHAITSVQKDSMVMNESVIRKLTPTECLRLQSMPDDYFDRAEYKGKPISNTQRYKMCGNAFNCAVIAHIIKSLVLSNN